MKKAPSKNLQILLKNAAWFVAALVLLSLMWYIGALIADNPFLLPSPREVLAAAAKLLGEGVFYSAFSATLLRCALSLIISLLLALILAVISVLFAPLYKLLAPIVTVLRAVPTMSVIFMLLLAFSPSTAPIFVTFLVVMPSMYSMITASFLATPKELIEMGSVFGLNKLSKVTKIYIPLSMPVLVESVASGFSLSLKILVASEVLSSTAKGIGYVLTLANLNLQIPRLLAVTLIAVAICIAFELAMRALNGRVSKHLY